MGRFNNDNELLSSIIQAGKGYFISEMSEHKIRQIKFYIDDKYRIFILLKGNIDEPYLYQVDEDYTRLPSDFHRDYDLGNGPEKLIEKIKEEFGLALEEEILLQV
jgi:hypothetical protein